VLVLVLARVVFFRAPVALFFALDVAAVRFLDALLLAVVVFDLVFVFVLAFVLDFALGDVFERVRLLAGERRRVDRPSDSWSLSSSPLPISFFATAAAAGTASPIAAPATTFLGVVRPSDSLFAISRLHYLASLNASMNFGTMCSRTMSGPRVAKYLPAASAASSAIGISASDAASQLVAAADARMD
jgi:hypothetical protein